MVRMMRSTTKIAHGIMMATGDLVLVFNAFRSAGELNVTVTASAQIRL